MYSGLSIPHTMVLDNLPTFLALSARLYLADWADQICSLSVFISILSGHLPVLFASSESPNLLDLWHYVFGLLHLLFDVRALCIVSPMIYDWQWLHDQRQITRLRIQTKTNEFPASSKAIGMAYPFVFHPLPRDVNKLNVRNTVNPSSTASTKWSLARTTTRTARPTTDF